MAQQTINNGETGLVVRGKINDNFTELYGSNVTPAALTKTDDTNVTLTLGGTPATALLQAVSITAGWTGTLSVARGGTGVGTSTGSGSLVLSQAPVFTGTTTLASVTSTGTWSVNTSGNAITLSPTTAALNLGSAQTSGLITLGGATGTGAISLGRSTASQAVGVANGATSSGNTKTLSIGTGGVSGSTTAITYGSTFGTTHTFSGVATFTSAVKLPTTTVGALPSAATIGAGGRYFVTDAAAPVYAAIVVGGGAVGIPVFSDGANWRAG